MRNPCSCQKSGGFKKSLCLRKIRRIYKIAASTEKQADDRILAGVEIPAPGENLRLKKNMQDWKSRRPAYCLGLAESPAADFLLVWLKSSRSDPRRCDDSRMQSQVMIRLRLPCFYGWPFTVLYRLFVPARHAKKWSKSRRQPKVWLSPGIPLISVKSQ